MMLGVMCTTLFMDPEILGQTDTFLSFKFR